MAWRNCRASIALIDEINRRWPSRDKASDGTIGDAAHASRSSDHNPWIVVDGTGVVRARDIDKDGIDAPWLVEFLRGRGEAGDARLTGGGYLIFNRRITTQDWRGWKTYTGSNPHTSHVHVSFSRNRAGFDSGAAWGITATPAAPPRQEDDLTPEEHAMLRAVFHEATFRIPNRRGPDGATRKEGFAGDTVLGMAANADGYGYRAERVLNELVAAVIRLERRPAVQVDVTAIVDAIARQGLAPLVADELARRLTPKGTPS